jgi:hypothetical protein
MKQNCWEAKRCGRQPGGHRAKEGICPVAKESRLHGVHDGTNAGRSCWIVAGSLCGDKVQGSFTGKFGNCMKCPFFAQVRDEEGGRYQMAVSLLERIA